MASPRAAKENLLWLFAIPGYDVRPTSELPELGRGKASWYFQAPRRFAQWGVRGLTPRPERLIWSSLALLLLVACSKDSGTNNSQPSTPTPTPTTLVVVSGDNQTGTVNQALAAAILVQVNDQSGNPMANIAVGFAVTQGAGLLAAPSVTTGSDGRASTIGHWGITAGVNTVTATVTSAPSLTGTFSATGTADVPIALTTSSPFNQIGPKGGTLPSPFVVTLEDLFGNGVEGETVEFVVAAGNGSVNPTMAVTDASGQASTTWTLEDALGVQILDVQTPHHTGRGADSIHRRRGHAVSEYGVTRSLGGGPSGHAHRGPASTSRRRTMRSPWMASRPR